MVKRKTFNCPVLESKSRRFDCRSQCTIWSLRQGLTAYSVAKNSHFHDPFTNGLQLFTAMAYRETLRRMLRALESLFSPLSTSCSILHSHIDLLQDHKGDNVAPQL